MELIDVITIENLELKKERLDWLNCVSLKSSLNLIDFFNYWAIETDEFLNRIINLKSKFSDTEKVKFFHRELFRGINITYNRRDIKIPWRDSIVFDFFSFLVPSVVHHYLDDAWKKTEILETKTIIDTDVFFEKYIPFLLVNCFKDKGFGRCEVWNDEANREIVLELINTSICGKDGTRSPNLLEKEFESNCCNEALTIGWTSDKGNAKLFKGIPDRIFRKKNCPDIYVEFKRPRGTTFKHQDSFIRELRSNGEIALVVKNWSDWDNVLNIMKAVTKVHE